MEIKNLEKVEMLAGKLRKLKRCSDLLQGGGTVKVYGSADNWEAIPSGKICQQLREHILAELKSIEEELKEL